MDNNTNNPADVQGLNFYWYEMKPDEEVATWWGQLAGGMHRLIPIREELEELCTQRRNVEKALRRLESHVESYLFRAYELRERALRLLVSRTQQSRTQQNKTIERLKHPETRNDALSELKPTDPELTTVVGNLLALLDGEIGLRNRHVHKTYLNFGFFTGSDFFDPYDALVDASDDFTFLRELEAQLRREVKKTARYYVDKVEALIDAVRKVLDAGDPYSRGEKTTNPCL